MTKIVRILGIATIPLLFSSRTALAHEKWFYEGPKLPMRRDLYFQPMPLSFTVGVLVLFGVACLLWRWPVRSGLRCMAPRSMVPAKTSIIGARFARELG